MADEVRLIDASKIEIFLHQMRYAAATHGMDYDVEIINIILETVEHEPTIEAEPVKHGWWEHGECSVCGASPLDHVSGDMYVEVDYYPNYCPNCGSKNRMDGGSE